LSRHAIQSEKRPHPLDELVVLGPSTHTHTLGVRVDGVETDKRHDVTSSMSYEGHQTNVRP